MTLLNNRNFLSEDEDIQNNNFVLPSVVTSEPEVIPLKKALAFSTVLHPVVVFLCWLLVFVMTIFGINLKLFEKPDIQLKKDIEFVLVDKEGTPRNPHTKNRADINSRSGGVNDPSRKVSMPSPTPKKVSKPSAPAAKKTAPKKVAQQNKAPVKQVAKNQNNNASKSNQIQKAQTRQSPAKPVPPTVRPSARPVSSPIPTAKPSSNFTVPAPKAAPIGKSLATGPIGGTSAPSGAKSGSSSGSQGTNLSSHSYAPRPSLSPSSGGGSGQLARGSSGYGNVGNPGGGGGAPGIDALREPDFGPYMRELQRRIKLNWDPPKGNESKRVVLLFKIARDGRLLSCRINKSSGLPSADQAALKAVELTAPFRPLPGDFKGQSIDIQFTFDYNVFNASRY